MKIVRRAGALLATVALGLTIVGSAPAQALDTSWGGYSKPPAKLR